jgi:hypothetical protein
MLSGYSTSDVFEPKPVVSSLDMGVTLAILGLSRPKSFFISTTTAESIVFFKREDKPVQRQCISCGVYHKPRGRCQIVTKHIIVANVAHEGPQHNNRPGCFEV